MNKFPNLALVFRMTFLPSFWLWSFFTSATLPQRLKEQFFYSLFVSFSSYFFLQEIRRMMEKVWGNGSKQDGEERKEYHIARARWIIWYSAWMEQDHINTRIQRDRLTLIFSVCFFNLWMNSDPDLAFSESCWRLRDSSVCNREAMDSKWRCIKT